MIPLPFIRLFALSNALFWHFQPSVFSGSPPLATCDKPIKPSSAKSACITFRVFRTLFLTFCPRLAHKWSHDTLLVGNPQYGSFDICKGKIFRTDPPGANHFWAIEQVWAEAQCGFFAFSADSLSRLFCHVCIYSYLCTIIS